MKTEIVDAFSQIVKEKNIDKDVLGEILESTIISIIKKKYGKADNFDIFVSMDKGEIEIYQSKTIVEKVEDEVTEIDLETAQRVAPDLELGDEFIEIINPESFGRRLIISAKQNLNQKLKDAEKEIMLDEFSKRIGEIIIGDVRQINRDEIYMNIDRTEVVMPRKEQIASERYRRGDHVRGIVKEVAKTNRGLEIIISRADPNFLIRLFELEVPEIYDGIIEIKSVAREPGERAKIAVTSNDKRIDALGACVGMKGIRIQAISRELNNEKIDVINWHLDPGIFISRSLSPAKVSKVIVDQNKRKAIAILGDSQISLAIGKGGQNRRLASRLTSYDIEIIKESDYAKIMLSDLEARENEKLTNIDGFTPSILRKLSDAEVETASDVRELGKEGLVQIPGIGAKTAESILDKIKNL